jgi:hypothetical protein
MGIFSAHGLLSAEILQKNHAKSYETNIEIPIRAPLSLGYYIV